MSYASGIMMGTAIIQGLSQLFGGMAAKGAGGMQGGMRGGMQGMGMLGSMLGGAKGGNPLLSGMEKVLTMPMESIPPRMPARALALVSSLPGRRRYRLANMTAKQAEMLEAVLSRLSFVKEAKANPVSGSLLILYDASKGAQIDEIAAAIEKNVLGKSMLPASGSSFAFPPDAYSGDLSRSIQNTMRAFSFWLKRNTGGLFDASSLVSSLLFVQGVRKLLATQQFPSASQLLWWAVSLMRGWRNV